ncbi:Iojap protein [hydrothermal vent metagenome]|jgi:ribosome-associated protein|uniref:Iojap protein n=1 Tax=hydrothermal vent metagenome TaxID=652676 RepID=A0A160TWR2_9ZZZZ|nr:ribosome silencing factor [Gammaproteobacteria bacterium]PDH43230.1 MAG: ribosome silencing factor [Candidatus Thioglobus sp. MED-G25]|tara:strand:- start:438 stop:833 length:396 start_codon:yes stop_codon:yes gene_type:complete
MATTTDPSVQTTEDLKAMVLAALEDAKANDVRQLDVRRLTDITDWMVVASGTSTRHVLALADHVRTQVKAQGLSPIGTEGESGSDWVLLDYGDVVVHLMLPDTRGFYDLEGLWDDRLSSVVQLTRERQTDL